ncbi:hypothetical protein Tcan_18526 [Toxocara canis]|uniref:GLOBIN domain-containing protein n=1 Tax=Toxocara canis TaxID=6265 RepID=A0A0B2W447_TOXCA|nr:hypothetical protein Tcan_18526 [Toxocara canis]
MPLRLLRRKTNAKLASKEDGLSNGMSNCALSSDCITPLFSVREKELIVDSWQRASSSSDLGADLVARLLNDKRSQFRTLLERRATCDIPMEEDQPFTVAIVKNSYPRAAAIGDGMVSFLHKLILTMKNPTQSQDELTDMCKELGARHYKMKVWFLAENWLSIKRCTTDCILERDRSSKARFLRRSQGSSQMTKLNNESSEKKRRKERPEEKAWFKVLQFVIRNMKQGFLEASLRTNQRLDLSFSSLHEERRLSDTETPICPFQRTTSERVMHDFDEEILL